MSIIVYQRLDNKDIILAADGMVVSGSEIQEPDKHKAFYLLSDMRMREYDRYIACGFTGDGSLIEFFKRNAGIYFYEKEYKINKIKHITSILKTIIETYLDRNVVNKDKYAQYDNDINGFWVDNDGQIFEICYYSQYGFINVDERENDWGALGCGSKYAMAAMDMGADCEQAINLASKHDIYITECMSKITIKYEKV